jgi:DnaK suppressor protein
MNPERLEHYNQKLQTLAGELSVDLDSGQDATEVVQLDTSIGRLSRMDAMQSQQMAMELQRRKQNQLQRVEAALKRVADGSYGLCRRCQKPIAEERLDFQPDALLCIECAGPR